MCSFLSLFFCVIVFVVMCVSLFFSVTRVFSARASCSRSFRDKLLLFDIIILLNVLILCFVLVMCVFILFVYVFVFLYC